jgi:hypothetical protein
MPVQTPENEVHSPADTDTDDGIRAGLLSHDIGIGRAVVQYEKLHPHCDHLDDRRFLPSELELFKTRDVLITDCDEQVLAGIAHKSEVPVSSIYRWMSMFYRPLDGWNFLRVSDKRIMQRTDVAPMEEGVYHIVDQGKLQLLCYIIRRSR